MRLAAITLLLLAAPVLGGTTGNPVVEKHVARGEKALAAAAKKEGTKLLRVLESAKPHFRRAQAVVARALKKAPEDEALRAAQAGVLERLVAILNAETVIYLDRGALSLAKKRNAEALKLLPQDDRAKELAEAIENPDDYELDAREVHAVLRANGTAVRENAPRDRRAADGRFLRRRGG